MATGRPRSTRFGVDAMLGSLARKLRAFGFDTAYYKDATDFRILAECRRQGRVLVSADRQLVERARRAGLTAFLASGKTDGRRLSLMVKASKESGVRLRRGEARCSLCNGRLARVSRATAVALVPDSVMSRHKVFYRCLSCGHVYWRGGHWKKLRRLERLFTAESRGTR